MLLLLLLVVFSLLVNTQGATAYEINITHSNELETVLCHSGPLSNDTIIVLFTNITHEITNISFCFVNTSHSLTIKSATNSLAYIRCPTAVSQPSYPTSGFAFINLYNLTLQKLSFQGCGAFLSDLDESILSSINSTTSPVYFTEYHSSLLLFLHIETILIKEVNMSSNYGFAVLAINPLNAIVENISITSTKSAEFYRLTNMSFGNGVLLLFIDESNVKHLQKNALIKGARFLNNFDYIHSIKCPSDLGNLVHQETFTPIPVVNAAGLTILYTQQNFSANVQISSTTFTRNTGSYSGAMLVLHFNGVTNSQTLIDNGNVFSKNSNLLSCHGAALSFFTTINLNHIIYQTSVNQFVLLVSKSTFELQNDFSDYPEKANSGAVSIVIQYPPKKMEFNVTVRFSNVTFFKNLVETTGACLFATTYSYEDHSTLIIVLENVIAYNNSQYASSTSISTAGMFTVDNIKALHIIGSNSHYYNNSGSVFEVIDSNIILDGNMSFEGNRGERGAVFKLYGSSTFHLNNGLRATFINNIAHTKGGAIYAQDNIYKAIKQCTFQILSPLQDLSLLNISMIFTNNTAGLSGSSIFSTNLYNCYMNGLHYTGRHIEEKYYDTIFHLNSSRLSPLRISTLSASRCVCIKQNCSNSYSSHKKAYPGQTLHIPMAAIDVLGNHVYSTVSLALARTNNKLGDKSLSPFLSWYILPYNENQVLLESQQCTLINFTLYKKDSNSQAIKNAVFIVSSPDDSSILRISLELLDCPLGFELNTIEGTCHCSSVIDKLGMVGDYQPTCQIVSNYSTSQFPLATITRPPDSAAWAGLMNITNGTNKTTVFGVALTCHESCNLNQDYTMFLINGTDVLIADPNNYLVNHLPLCPPIKTGPLCSTCTTVNGIKYSVVFGSSECKQCSNWWLLTLILYAIAGPLLIYLLFAIKLTLTTGTLNAIIFYAQAIGIIDLKISSQNIATSLYSLTNAFLSMLSFNLGFPLCFYNGMTELWKAGLSLVFPLYLLTIVVVLVILSRYSLRLSNRIAHSSVQVLVTVVHLSFTSMFTAISSIVIPINIYTNDTCNPILKVWYRDGTVEYGKGGHLILMILIIVVVGPVLLSYMTILVAGRPLMRVAKLREYIRPVYEAIHGPYNHNKEFFFTARLLLLVFLYILCILYRTGDIYKGYAIATPVIAIYMTIESFCRPFCKIWLNMLDLFVMWDCVIVSGITWYYLKINNSNQVSIILSTTTTIVFLTLVTVIIFHILWVTGTIKKIKPKLYILKMKFTFLFYSKAHYNPQSPKLKTSDLEGSFFDTYDETREPLLSPT